MVIYLKLELKDAHIRLMLSVAKHLINCQNKQCTYCEVLLWVEVKQELMCDIPMAAHISIILMLLSI